MSTDNKAIVLEFYQKLLLDRNVAAAFEQHGGSYYRQHNPLVADGQDGVDQFVAWIATNQPNATATLKRVFVDGDFVILHSHWKSLFGSERGEAVVDIFRVEDGKVVEHWDVIQPIPETSANGNTMF